MSFEVTVRKKSTNHPWYCPKLPKDQQPECSDAGYVIDGKEGMVLFLNRGQTYTFEINTPGHPFYFTTSKTGGKGENDRQSLIPQNKVTDQGTLTITIDESFPDTFYYQCQVHPRMGGRVQISLNSNSYVSPSYDEYSSPSYGYGSPSYGYSSPSHGYSSPSYGYSSPSYGYSSPSHGYSSPSHGYSSPSHGSLKMTLYGNSGSDPMSRKEYLMDIARLAQSYGFVPIPIYNKAPRFKNWQNVRFVPSDPDKNIRRVGHLVNAGIANNLGIVTGEASGVVVLDVDKGSVDWFNELSRLNGGLPNTFSVFTGGSGYHIYFKYEPRVQHLGNMNKIGGQHIDFRTTGGQAIFPGSISDKTGQVYQVMSGYENNQPQISEMPDWLVLWLTQNIK